MGRRNQTSQLILGLEVTCSQADQRTVPGR